MRLYIHSIVDVIRANHIVICKLVKYCCNIRKCSQTASNAETTKEKLSFKTLIVMTESEIFPQTNNTINEQKRHVKRTKDSEWTRSPTNEVATMHYESQTHCENAPSRHKH